MPRGGAGSAGPGFRVFRSAAHDLREALVVEGRKRARLHARSSGDAREMHRRSVGEAWEKRGRSHACTMFDAPLKAVHITRL